MPRDGGSALFRLYAALALADAEAVTAGDVHDAWSAWMQERDLDHRALRRYEELHETRRADEPFAAAVRRADRYLAPRAGRP